MGQQNRPTSQTNPFETLSTSLRLLAGLPPQDPASLLQQRLNDPCKYINSISNDVTGIELDEKEEEDDDNAASNGRWTIEEK